MKRKRVLKIILGLTITLIIIGIGYSPVEAAIIRQQSKATIERLDPPAETHESYTERGEAYANIGKLELAIADFDYATALHPTECANIYTNRGWANIELGNYEQAVLDFEKAIKTNSIWYGGYHGRAAAYGYLGQFNLAHADIEKAISLEPSHPTLYQTQAEIYRLEGDSGGAVTSFLLSLIKLASTEEPAGASDHPIEFQPLVDNQSRLRTQVPNSWHDVGNNFYNRSVYDEDFAQIAIQRADTTIVDWKKWIAEEYSGEGLSASLDFEENMDINGQKWYFYSSNFYKYPVHIAFTQRDNETLMVLLASVPEDAEFLYKQVFIPTVHATEFLDN